MKRVLFFSIALAFASALPALAQDQEGAAGGGGDLGLSQADQAHFLKVRQEVLDNNPQLKQEQDSLEKERQFLKDKGSDASTDDRRTFWQNMKVHHENMSAAMLKQDPSIKPILDQIDQKMKERFRQRFQNGGNGSGDAGAQ